MGRRVASSRPPLHRRCLREARRFLPRSAHVGRRHAGDVALHPRRRRRRAAAQVRVAVVRVALQAIPHGRHRADRREGALPHRDRRREPRRDRRDDRVARPQIRDRPRRRPLHPPRRRARCRRSRGDGGRRDARQGHRPTVAGRARQARVGAGRAHHPRRGVGVERADARDLDRGRRDRPYRRRRDDVVRRAARRSRRRDAAREPAAKAAARGRRVAGGADVDRVTG